MSRRFIPVFAALVLLGTAAIWPARAAQVSASDLLDPKLDYAADFYVTTGAKGSFEGTVLHAPGRERREFDTRMGREALVLRRDIDEATILWPERKMYVSSSFTAVSGMIGGFDELMLDRRKTGSEVIANEPCTRYEVTGSSDQGGSFKGRMWFTRDNILMKAVGVLRFQGQDTPVETGLLNLRRLKTDVSAFNLPSDYSGLPIDLSKFGLSVK